MPNYLRNALLYVILASWLAYGLVSYFSFHVLPPYEFLLVPSATIGVLSSPGLVGKVLKKFIPEKEDEKK